MNCIIISIDGLHHGFLGCFGNTWIQTPAVDALAVQSVLFDRYYVEALQLPPIFELLWNHQHNSVPTAITEQGFETIWMTDNRRMFLNEHSDGFSKRFFIDRAEITAPVDTFEQTEFYLAMQQFIETARRQTKYWQINRKKQYFVWMHLSAFRGWWDFPSFYRNKHRDIKEDPPPYPNVRPPRFLSDRFTEEGSDVYLPDRIQSVIEAYSGGIANLDDALAMLLDAADNGDFGCDTAIILFSSRGFSLAEHGKIGMTDDFYSENICLPLIIRLPQDICAGVRSPALLKPSDLAEFFSSISAGVEENPSLIASLALENAAESSLRKHIVLHNTSHLKTVITPDWFLRRTLTGETETPELYVKPDDYWEVNNVANRCPEIVESLTAEFFSAEC